MSNGAKTAAFGELYNACAHAVTMELQRIAEGPHSTLGVLTVDEGGKEVARMYTLERGGPSSGVEGSKKRILAGEYDVKPYDSDNFHGKYKLTNSDSANHRTNVLIHTGNKYGQTEGCVIVGTDYGRTKSGDYFITGRTSKPAFDILHGLVGNHQTTLTVRDI